MSSFVVVGASRGLGYGWLQFLSKNPSNTVIGLARTPAPVEENLTKDGITNVRILQADMASHASMTKAAELAAPLLPSGIDYLIVNGAYMSTANVFTTPSQFASASKADELAKEMHTSLDTNVLGVVYTINAFLPLVLKGSVKKVIVISTGLADPDVSKPADGSDGVDVQVAYSAMKGALNIVVAKFAMELKSQGVMTLALSPGLIQTSTEPPSPEMITGFTKLFGLSVQRYPHFTGPASVEESIQDQMKVIENLKMEQSGQFVSHLGNKQWL